MARELVEELESIRPKSEADKMALAAAKVLIPVLRTAIGPSVEPAVAKSAKMRAGFRKNAYNLDKLQQYGRRENLRIAGIAEEEWENLKEKVKEIGLKVGVEIRYHDINVVHRSGQRGGGARPRIVLVRFISRDVKHVLLKKRKNFKVIEALKNIYIGDDLTPLRAKLLKRSSHLGMSERLIPRMASFIAI